MVRRTIPRATPACRCRLGRCIASRSISGCRTGSIQIDRTTAACASRAIGRSCLAMCLPMRLLRRQLLLPLQAEAAVDVEAARAPLAGVVAEPAGARVGPQVPLVEPAVDARPVPAARSSLKAPVVAAVGEAAAAAPRPDRRRRTCRRA